MCITASKGLKLASIADGREGAAPKLSYPALIAIIGLISFSEAA